MEEKNGTESLEQRAVEDVIARYTSEIEGGSPINVAAAKWLGGMERLATQGNSCAAYRLWGDLTTGSLFMKVDPVTAYKWLHLSAKMGHKGAKSDLQALENERSVLIDEVQRGSGLCAYNLYEAYMRGDFGAVNEVLANHYLEQSALLGYKRAIKRLKLLRSK